MTIVLVCSNISWWVNISHHNHMENYCKVSMYWYKLHSVRWLNLVSIIQPAMFFYPKAKISICFTNITCIKKKKKKSINMGFQIIWTSVLCIVIIAHFFRCFVNVFEMNGLDMICLSFFVKFLSNLAPCSPAYGILQNIPNKFSLSWS